MDLCYKKLVTKAKAEFWLWFIYTAISVNFLSSQSQVTSRFYQMHLFPPKNQPAKTMGSGVQRLEFSLCPFLPGWVTLGRSPTQLELLHPLKNNESFHAFLTALEWSNEWTFSKNSLWAVKCAAKERQLYSVIFHSPPPLPLQQHNDGKHESIDGYGGITLDFIT